MKKLLLGLMLFAGCSPKEPFIEVARSTQPTAVSVTLPVEIERVEMTFDEKGLHVNKSTVTVMVQGSGVFITRYGHVLTCAHLFRRPTPGPITITTFDGTQIPATLIYKDDDKDLGLLKVPGIHPYALISKQEVKIGQTVLAIGNPSGLGFTVTHGIISNLNRNLGDVFMYTQTDTPINPGNSGGPLFNLAGEIVGIVVAIIPDKDGLAFAVTQESIEGFLNMVRM